MFFNHALGSTVDVRDSTFMSTAVTSGASQLILSEQLVTYLAHTKEQFKPSLTNYWWGGGGGGGGAAADQVTSRTENSKN